MRIAGIELAVREHLLKEVAPEIGNFFKQQQRHRKEQEDSNQSGNMAKGASQLGAEYKYLGE